MYDLHYFLFQPLQCFLSMHMRILDTDDFSERLTKYTLANDNQLATIDEKLRETNYTGIVYLFSDFIVSTQSTHVHHD